MKPKPLNASQFRELGSEVVNKLAQFLEEINERDLTRAETPSDLQKVLGSKTIPEYGMDAKDLIDEIFSHLLDHSLYNGHPGFMGYITSSGLPIGALADLIASTINQNVGGWRLAPMASEIERQTISWISEFIGYDTNCSGVLVSGGNMANFLGFLTAKTIKGGVELPQKGLKQMNTQLLCYTSEETHTWIQKASDLFGLGKEAVRWIATDANGQMRMDLLEEKIKEDLKSDHKPFLVVGTAGSVSFGVVDPLAEISDICKKYDLWFHIDGAYGAPAAASKLAPAEFQNLNLADSLAMDPHKWLYSPLEVGCTLVKNENHLKQTFSHSPLYYEFGNMTNEIDYHEYGLQNSRGFRALKVWMGFKLLGKRGFIELIEKDIELSRLLAEKIKNYECIEVYSNHLSITTFRYIPQKLRAKAGEFQNEINEINKDILHKIFESGKAFVSNAYQNETYLLRACLVNFRTREEDLDTLLRLVDTFGKELD